ncbi:MAG: tetratricopeptide repeat protein [Clostridium sp.]|nr:tetratricopeptide repeat protein [Clostridium sp.]
MRFLKKLFEKTVPKVILGIFIVIILLSVFVFWGWYVKQVNKAFGLYYVYQGDKAYKAHKLEKAINLYKKGLDKYPEHSLARCNLGNIYVKYEDYYSAVEEYEKALEYDPKFIVCRMNLGIISAEKLSDFDKAIREYQTIIDTKRVTFHIPLIFDSVKSTRENKTIAWYNMGIAYRGKSMLMGEKSHASNEYLEKAIEAYKKALKRKKHSYNINYNYALANHILGNYKEAGLSYCRAIEEAPMAFDAHYNLAILLKKLGKLRESQEELEKALLLSNTQQDPYISKYIFGIYSTVIEKSTINKEMETTQRGIAPESQIKEGMKTPHIETDVIENENDPLGINHLTYVNGKVVVDSEEADKFLKKSLAKCTAKKIFEEYEEDTLYNGRYDKDL